MKYIKESKSTEIELPEYPFYLKVFFTKRASSYIWFKDEKGCTVCDPEQLYNTTPVSRYEAMIALNANFEEITKKEFEEQVKKTVDFLTLIPFSND